MGALLGARHLIWPRGRRRLIYLLQAFLLTQGALFLTLSLFCVLDKPGLGAQRAAASGVLLMTPALGGAIAQLAIPVRALWTSGSGFLPCLGLFFVGSAVHDGNMDPAALVVASMVLAPLSLGMGAVGARVAWAWKESQQSAPVRGASSDLPAAQVVEKGSTFRAAG